MSTLSTYAGMSFRPERKVHALAVGRIMHRRLHLGGRIARQRGGTGQRRAGSRACSHREPRSATSARGPKRPASLVRIVARARTRASAHAGYFTGPGSAVTWIW